MYHTHGHSQCTGCFELKNRLDELEYERDKWLLREGNLETTIKTLSIQIQSTQKQLHETQEDLKLATEKMEKCS